MKKVYYLFKRFIAFIIDVFAFYYPSKVARFSHGELILIWILYDSLLIYYLNGKTFGKKWMGLKVISENNETISLELEPLPESPVPKIISTLILLLGDLQIIGNSKSQAWHDKMVRTLVILNDK